MLDWCEKWYWDELHDYGHAFVPGSLHSVCGEFRNAARGGHYSGGSRWKCSECVESLRILKETYERCCSGRLTAG